MSPGTFEPDDAAVLDRQGRAVNWRGRRPFWVKAALLLLFVFWITVFAIGSTVSSRPYRAALNVAAEQTTKDAREREEQKRERVRAVIDAIVLAKLREAGVVVAELRSPRETPSGAGDEMVLGGVQVPGGEPLDALGGGAGWPAGEIDATASREGLIDMLMQDGPAGGVAPLEEDRVDRAARSLFSAAAVTKWVLVVLTFTPSNIAILCCTASMLGSLGRRAHRFGPLQDRRAAGVEVEAEPEPGTRRRAEPAHHVASALVRGFCMYLLLLSGLLVLTSSPFLNSSAEEYVRLAGTASLLGFIVGWRPTTLSQFLNRVLSDQKLESDERGGKAASERS